MSNIEFFTIDSIEEKESDELVYDIELADIHYFSANNIISHNCRLRSETDNRFFAEEKYYIVTLEDGNKIEIESRDLLKVKNIETGVEHSLYVDEIKDKLHLYDVII